MSDERRGPDPAQGSEPAISVGAVRPRVVVGLPLPPPAGGAPEHRIARQRPLPVLRIVRDFAGSPEAAPAPRDTGAEDSLELEVARGLRYTHYRANANTTQLLEVASSVGAVIEALARQGLVDPAELDRRKAALREPLAARFSGAGMGVSFQSDDRDKYQLEGVRIDCENRVRLCGAACCRLRFALSPQDVEEGIVRWDFAQPYLIAQRPDHSCHHLDPEHLYCAIHANRPGVCRTYDCRGDRRIWLDFEKGIVNPQIHEPDWLNCLSSREGGSAVAASGTHAGEFAQSEVRSAGAGVAGLLSRGLQRLIAPPVLYRFRGGRYAVTSYGAYLSAAVGAAVFYGLNTTGTLVGDPKVHAVMILGLILTALLGAKVIFAVERMLALRLGQPVVGQRGSSLNGGLLGGLVYSVIVFRHDPTALLRFADWAAPAVALGHALGKPGCLSSGCCVGRIARTGPAIRYTDALTKAVAVYGLRGVPLVPVQLYETAMGWVIFAGLSLLPTAWYGTGRVLGGLLLAFALGRALLRRWRYQVPDGRAGDRVAGTLHLAFAAAGVLLLAGVPGGWLPEANAGPALGSVPLAWSMAVAVGAAALALTLHGIYRTDEAPGPLRLSWDR